MSPWGLAVGEGEAGSREWIGKVGWMGLLRVDRWVGVRAAKRSVRRCHAVDELRPTYTAVKSSVLRQISIVLHVVYYLRIPCQSTIHNLAI